MKVIFRSNDSLSKQFLGRAGGAEDWIQNTLGNYLSDDSLVRLSLDTYGIDEAVARLNIVDNGLPIYAKSSITTRLSAIEEVIKKALVQLNKTKRINKSNSKFDDIDELVDLDAEVINVYDFMEAEQDLDEKKKTTRYNRTMQRYVNYLYDVKDLENAINSAENHLAVLYSIFESEKNKMPCHDCDLLIESIHQLKTEINNLICYKNNYVMNARDEAYINESINEELNLLKLKRK